MITESTEGWLVVNVGLPGSLILYLTEPLCRSESMIPAVLQFWNISNRTVYSRICGAVRGAEAAALPSASSQIYNIL